MKILFRSLPAALLMLALLTAAASAKTVTVRVEGAAKTLVPSTKVTIPDGGQSSALNPLSTAGRRTSRPPAAPEHRYPGPTY